MHSAQELIERQMRRWDLMHQMETTAGANAETTTAPEPVQPMHPVITISRQIGSGARDIAELLAHRLNYLLMGKELINLVAHDLNVSQQIISSLDEHIRGDLDLMIESFLRGRELERNEYLHALVRSIRMIAVKGGVVLIGRGAAYVLRHEAALNVLVVAPREQRIQRLMDYFSISAAAASDKLTQVEHEREHFCRQMFKIDPNDSVHYDLVINTERLNGHAACNLIEQALIERGFNLARLAVPVSREITLREEMDDLHSQEIVLKL